MPAVPLPRPPNRPKWYYRPSSVVFPLFFVLGPFGLPLLWKSPGFFRGMKIALAVAVMVYSALLVETVLMAVRAAMEQMEVARRQARSPSFRDRPGPSPAPREGLLRAFGDTSRGSSIASRTVMVPNGPQLTARPPPPKLIVRGRRGCNPKRRDG